MFAFSTSVIGKKWVGGNSDASSVAGRRRNLALQKEATANEKMSGTTNLNNTTVGGINKSLKGLSTTRDNTISSAMSRVRGGGYIVPTKKSQKYLSNVGPDSGLYQSDVPGSLNYLFTNYGNNFGWSAIACDLTGKKIVVGGINNTGVNMGMGIGVYISNNWGENFSPTSSRFNVTSLACNNSGDVIIGCDNTVPNNAGNIIPRTFISIDGGKTWYSRTVGGSAVCCNKQNGQYMIGGGNSAGLSYSHDFGDTWTNVDSTSYNWTGMASSDSGQYAVIVSSDGHMLRTSTWGTNWNQILVGSGYNWVSICCNSTCTYFAAITNNGELFVSLDGGASLHSTGIKGASGIIFTGLSCDSIMKQIMLSSKNGLYKMVYPYNTLVMENPPLVSMSQQVDHSLFSSSIMCRNGMAISATLSNGGVLTYRYF